MSNRELPPSSILGSIERSSPCLRSLLLLNDENATLVSKLALSDFICLRALDLHSSGIRVLSDSIGEMMHLRYLNLSYNLDMRLIPESICSLTNLRTLDLFKCRQLKSLPENMRKMSSLRHLDIRECDDLQSMPIGMGKLTCLCTLSNFIVGKESGNGVDELQGLNNLRGELEIRGLEKVKNPTEAKVANLMNKKHLHSLGLIFCSPKQHQQGNEIQEEIIEGLQPHENLRKLKVEGYGGVSCSPSWLTAVGVPNLVEITLGFCTRWEHLPPLGKLRYLKVLKLHGMKSLKFIDVDGGGGFQSLEEIDFSSLPNLEGWSSSLSLSSLSLSSLATQVAVFPRLKTGSLDECPKLTGGIPLAYSPVQSVDMTDCNSMFLGSLRDLPCLPYLRISIDEPYFPQGALLNLAALETLVIQFCDNLKALPVELKSLAKLTKLEIYMCSNLVSLVEGGLKNLSSLETLEIVCCDALERLPELEKTSLVNLRIRKCREMEFLKEDFEQLVALEILILSYLPKLTCFPEGGLKNLSSLKTLEIVGCDALERLPELEKTSLVNLRIKKCREMEFLKEDFEQLVALETLTLSYLPKLTCFPEGRLKNLSTLKTLEIKNCNALKRLPELEKTSLVNLRIKGCREMEFLKEDFEQLVALETLTLSFLPKLTCFPEGIKDSAGTLKHLEMWGYPYDDVMDLPDWIGTCLIKLEFLYIAPKNWKVLPQWMQHLAALKTLRVWGCNEELSKRWERWKGWEEDDEVDEEYDEDNKED